MLNFPQGGAGDHATAASPFSFVYLPLPWTPLFDDQAGAQQLQLPFQNHIDVSAVEPRGQDDKISGEQIRAARKKRDRHSKIVTCSRPRHRRMRLSIEVARQFFDLQERLGFERASKTVEWLLIRARSDIKKLHRESGDASNASASSPSSDCEAGSTLSADESKPQEKVKRKYCRRLPAQPPRRSAFAPEAKRARKIARMKARQRTLEKKLALGIPVDPDLLVMSIQHCQEQNLNLIQDPQQNYHDRFYGDDHHLDCHGLRIAEQENGHQATGTAMTHEDLYCAFLNADKFDQSLLYSVFSNDSLQISTSLPQEQQQHQISDYQLLLKAWCMSSNTMS